MEETHWKQNQFSALDLPFCLVTIWLLIPNYLWGNNFTYFKAISPIDSCLPFFLRSVCFLLLFFEPENIFIFRAFLHQPFKQDLQSKEHFLYTTKLLSIPITSLKKQIRNHLSRKTPGKRDFGICSILIRRKSKWDTLTDLKSMW